MAPLVRTIAWATAFLSTLCVLLIALGYAVGFNMGVLVWLGVAGVTGFALATVIRLLAMGMRPHELTWPLRTAPRA